jgi:hypothetical protein
VATLTELHGTFSRDPLAFFLELIQQSGKPVTFDEIRALLVQNGLSDHLVTTEWIVHERMIKSDVHITYLPETRTYAWGPAMELPDAMQAVLLLASGKAQINPDRKTLGDIVLAALQAPKPPSDEERLKADSARAYAKVAMELEELIASGASGRALLQRIHAGAQALGLRPIETAGATIRFDRLRHDPVLSSTQDGSEVLVVRPGYMWQAGDKEVLVAKPVVIER